MVINLSFWEILINPELSLNYILQNKYYGFDLLGSTPRYFIPNTLMHIIKESWDYRS
tara:strand:- start:426 stop:596 length:171 start_codon:yes stop_codon:yes gene_type:complete